MCFRPATTATPKICPKCGQINPVIASRCIECGEELPENRIKCPHCGEMNDTNNMLCSECGSDLSGFAPSNGDSRKYPDIPAPSPPMVPGNGEPGIPKAPGAPSQ